MFSPDRPVRRCREPTDRDPEGPRRAAGAGPARTADPAHRDPRADRTGETRALNATAASSRLGGRLRPASSPARCWSGCTPAAASAGCSASSRSCRGCARSTRTDRSPATLLGAWAMSVAFTAAVFAWFGARDRQLHAARRDRRPGAAARSPRRCSSRSSSPSRWCATSPRRRHGPSLGALAGAAAWVATEWLVPRLLGDTLGYGLYPSRLLRQAADRRRRGGPHARCCCSRTKRIAAALARRAGGVRAMARPLALAALVPLLLAAYGAAALARRADVPPASRCAWDSCSRTSSTTSACAARRAPTRSFARCSTPITR